MRGVKDRKFGKNKKALNKTFHCYNLFLFIEEIIIQVNLQGSAFL